MTVSSFFEFTNINFSASLWGNTLAQYAQALFVFAVLAIVFKLVQFLLLRRLAILAKRTTTDLDDTFIKIVRSLRPPFYYFVSFYFATQSLTLSSLAEQVINGALGLLLVRFVSIDVIL